MFEPQGSLIIEEGEFSTSELRAAQWMAKKWHQVILRQPRGTRVSGGTSGLIGERNMLRRDYTHHPKSR